MMGLFIFCGLAFLGFCVVIAADRIASVIEVRLSSIDVNVSLPNAIKMETRIVSEEKEAAE